MSDEQKLIDEIIANAKTIAVVGMSAKTDRPSHGVAKYLIENGYKVIPVNPTADEIDGMKCYPSLMAIPDEIEIDVADIFRRSEDIPAIVEEAIARKIKYVWMQLGITNAEAAENARAQGIGVVMNKCMKIEYEKRR